MAAFLNEATTHAMTLNNEISDGNAAALKQLWALTMREAHTLTYADAFLAIFVCFVIAVPMVVLMRKVAPPSAPSADAH